ncbi:MAG: hypothetical protein ACPGUV_03380 [Polyangiales bacterium]
MSLGLLGTVAALSACSVGAGEGEVMGNVSIRDCPKAEGAYDLRPSFFAAEAFEETLNIRVQRGSAFPVVSDGLAIFVRDAEAVQQGQLGQALAVSDAPELIEGAAVRVTLYLNALCPRERDTNPVVLKAVSGTAIFSAIYAPDVDDDAIDIAAELQDLRFVDSRESALGSAQLSGRFRFPFNRGRPAQAFP